MGVVADAPYGARPQSHPPHRPVLPLEAQHGRRLRRRHRQAGRVHAPGDGRRAVPRALPTERRGRDARRRGARGLLQPLRLPRVLVGGMGESGRAVRQVGAPSARVPNAAARSRRVPLLLHMLQQQPHIAHTRHGRTTVRGVRYQAGVSRRRLTRDAKGDDEPDGHAKEGVKQESIESIHADKRFFNGRRAARGLLLVSHRGPAPRRDRDRPPGDGVRVQGQVHRRERLGVDRERRWRRRPSVQAPKRLHVQGGAGGSRDVTRGRSQGGGVRVPLQPR